MKLAEGKFYNITVASKTKKSVPYDRHYRVKYRGQNEEFYYFLIDAGKVHYKVLKEIVTAIKPAKKFA